MTDPVHVVLGASGGAGTAIVGALTERGHAVRAVSRSGNATVPDGVEPVTADITDPASAATAVTGADVVYMAAQPAYFRWVQEFPSMLATVVDAVATAGARLVMVDNLYMYAPSSQPLTERSSTGSGTKKGRVRIRLEAILHEAETDKGLEVAIGRASDYFGPGSNLSTITTLAIGPGITGKPIKWMGRLDKKHSVAYLPDIARAYVTLGESDAAYGETWILPHGPAPTGAEFLEAVNRALPHPVRTGAISKTMLMVAAPFHRISRESLEMMYQWTDDFVVDDSKFRSAFGPFETTPLNDAVLATIAGGQGKS
ncbi:MAG: NAD-dependent epimerase/dehydratase family protein [Actinomycetota bacterium]